MYIIKKYFKKYISISYTIHIIKKKKEKEKEKEREKDKVRRRSVTLY
jgi:hypothetical protein